MTHPVSKFQLLLSFKKMVVFSSSDIKKLKKRNIGDFTSIRLIIVVQFSIFQFHGCQHQEQPNSCSPRIFVSSFSIIRSSKGMKHIYVSSANLQQFRNTTAVTRATEAPTMMPSGHFKDFGNTLLGTQLSTFNYILPVTRFLNVRFTLPKSFSYKFMEYRHFTNQRA